MKPLADPHRFLRSVGDLRVLADAPRLPRPDRVLLADPLLLQPSPHSAPAQRLAARRQWRDVQRWLAAGGVAVDVARGAPAGPSAALLAHAALPAPAGFLDESASFVTSLFGAPQRQVTAELVANHLTGRRLHREDLDAFSMPSFEGLADARWLPDSAALIAALPPGEEPAALSALSAWLAVPVVLLELSSEVRHLHDGLSLLDAERALCCPEAFAEASVDLLRALFPKLSLVSRVAAGALSVEPGRVLLPAGGEDAGPHLEAAGWSWDVVPAEALLAGAGPLQAVALPYWSGPGF